MLFKFARKYLRQNRFLLFLIRGINVCETQQSWKRPVCLLFILSFVVLTEGREIRFPTEELAREYMLPVFEGNPRATMNRKVVLKHKLDVFGAALFRGDEPFYFPLMFFPGIAFYFNEMHGVSITGVYFWPGLSSKGEQLLRTPTRDQQFAVVQFNAALVPHPQWGVFAHYLLTPFYGKISLSKTLIVHFNLSISAGVGALNLVQNQCAQCTRGRVALESVAWRPAVWLGLKQRFFLGRRFYTYGEFGFFSYYGPNPVNENAKSSNAHPPEDFMDPSLFYFERDSREVFLFRNVIGVGIGMLLF